MPSALGKRPASDATTTKRIAKPARRARSSVLSAARMAAHADVDQRYERHTTAYEALAASTGGDVHVDTLYSDELERDRLVRHAWREVEPSVTSFLLALKEATARLPGLDPAERSEVADRMASETCRLLSESIRCCHEQGCSAAMFEERVAALHAQICAGAQRQWAERTAMRRSGVAALQRLCAAVEEERDLELGSGTVAGVLDFLLSHPPAGMAADLRAAGAPLEELHSYLGLTGAVDIQRRCIARWARQHREAVDMAATAALTSELRDAASRDAEWSSFANMVVWHETSAHIATAMATGGTSAVTPCPKPTHTHGNGTFYLVATATSQKTAVWCVRISAAVLELARVRALVPRMVRAEALIGPVGMQLAATMQAYDELVNETDGHGPSDAEEEEEEGGYEQEDGEEDDTMDTATEASADHLPWHHSAAPGTEQATVTLEQAAAVHKSMLRDYVVLVVARTLVSNHQGVAHARGVTYLSVSQVADHMQQLPDMGAPVTPMVASTPRCSLRQTVGWVLQNQVAKRIAAVGDVAYARMPATIGGTMGLRMSPRGVELMLSFLGATARAMLPPVDPDFAKAWHPSRSARSHARRKQSKNARDVGSS